MSSAGHVDGARKAQQKKIQTVVSDCLHIQGRKRNGSLHPFETLLSDYQTNKLRHNSKDNDMNLRRLENLRYFNAEKDEHIIHVRDTSEAMNPVLEAPTSHRHDDWFSYQQKH
jgi:hypothetical protein